ncbi:translocation/assembly module TamB domain-containing protein [Fretibacter rubidus]|uniref:translocation/assembly module TamB domain-containing protein n=1 Tax=Fretibacter rubidus TaxID=570162 RepID=UPI00352A39B1
MTADMSTETSKRSWVTKALMALSLIIIIALMLIVGFRVFITTSSGHRFIENQVEGRVLGPIDGVEIDGLSGDPLGAFTIDSVSIKDASGVWMRADNIAVKWSPMALLSKHLKFEDIDIATVAIDRRPVLRETEGGEGALPKVTLDAFKIEAVKLDPTVLGQAAIFEINGAARLTDNQKTAQLSLLRTDSDGDRLTLDIMQNESGDITGDFDIFAPAGGPLANISYAPSNQNMSAKGRVDGTQESGEGTATLRFGERKVADIALSWTPAQAILNAAADMSAWPDTSNLSEMFGVELTASATLQRDARKSVFTADITAEHLNLRAEGELGTDNSLPETVQIDAAIDNPNALGVLPEGYSAGGLSVSGQVQRTALSFDGRMNLKNAITPYGRIAQFSGPITASADGAFDVNINGQGVALTLQAPIALADTASLSASGDYDAALQRLTLRAARLRSGPLNITTKGTATVDAAQYSLSGSLAVPTLATGQIPSGLISADYRLEKARASTPALSTTGQFVPKEAFAEPLGGLVGERLRFQTKMSPIEGGIKIIEAGVSTKAMRLAAEGVITDRYAVDVEATTLVPLSFDTVTAAQPTELSAKISGPRDNPNIRIQGTAPMITAAGYDVRDVTVKADFDTLLSSPTGAVQLTAETDYGPLALSTDVVLDNGAYQAADLDASLGPLSLKGDMTRFATGLLDGRLSLDLPRSEMGYGEASLILNARETGEQGVALNANAKNIAYADFEIDSLTAQASGSLSALSGDITLEGRRLVDSLARPIALNTPLSLARGDAGAITASLSPEGRYGNITFTHASPVTASYDSGTVALNMPLQVIGEPFSVSYTRTDAGLETVSIDASNLPMSLFPLPGDLADSRGRWSVDGSITAQSGVPTGSMNFTIADWRGFGVDAQTGLNINTQAQFNASQANLTIDGSSPSGFDIEGDIRVPFVTGDSLTALRPAMTAPLSGELRASGPAETVLGLVTPPNADLNGNLDMSVSVGGTLSAPQVNGRASGSALSFEAPQAGTQIRQGRFLANFTNDSLSVSDVYFTDTRDGVATGAGEFTLGEFGRPLGKLTVTSQRFHILDRRDLTARVSGDVSYESLADKALVSGNVKIGEAEIKQFVASQGVSVIEIPVKEINVPERLKSNTSFDTQPALPINLDVTVSAPRRIFVRSKGLDVELSANAVITGTLSDPLINGTAEVERGSFKIAGKELQFDAGSVEFNGPVSTAKLSLEATADTANLTASVVISGTLEDPNIELSSTPERPDDEILSALLFGRSATELSTLEAAQLAGAIAQFSGNGVGFDLLGGLRDSLGVGQLSVNIADDGTAQITGGRYLTRNVYLQVFSGVDASTAGAVIDWELRRNLSLRSKLQADNEQSLSLSYKKDF